MLLLFVFRGLKMEVMSLIEVCEEFYGKILEAADEVGRF